MMYLTKDPMCQSNCQITFRINLVCSQGFEGVLVGRRLDGKTEEMTTPTSRTLTQINDGGGVLKIQQVIYPLHRFLIKPSTNELNYSLNQT